MKTPTTEFKSETNKSSHHYFLQQSMHRRANGRHGPRQLSRETNTDLSSSRPYIPLSLPTCDRSCSIQKSEPTSPLAQYHSEKRLPRCDRNWNNWPYWIGPEWDRPKWPTAQCAKYFPPLFSFHCDRRVVDRERVLCIGIIDKRIEEFCYDGPPEECFQWHIARLIQERFSE